MAVTTTNLGVITAYGDAVAAGYTGTKAEWQALMASYATVAEEANDAKDDAVAAKNTAVTKATEATTAATTATTKASEASASAESIAQSASQIQENTDDIAQLKSEFTAVDTEVTDIRVGADGTTYNSAGAAVRGQISGVQDGLNDLSNMTPLAFMKNAVWEIGTLDGSGNNSATWSRIRTKDHIDLSEVVTLYFSIESGYKFSIHFYDSNKTKVSYQSSDTWSTTSKSFVIPSNIKYMRVVLSCDPDENMSNTSISQYLTVSADGTLVGNVNDLNTKVNEIIGADVLQNVAWERGTIDETGTVVSSTSRIVTPALIDLANVDAVLFDIQTGYKYGIHEYDSDQNFVQTRGWTTKSNVYVVPDAVRFIRITMAAEPDTWLGDTSISSNLKGYNKSELVGLAGGAEDGNILIKDWFVSTSVNKKEIPVLDSTATILALGDSITAATDETGWIYHFTNMTGCTAINKAVGGTTFGESATEDSGHWMLTQIGNVSAAQWSAASLVIVACGTNDYGHGTPLSELKTKVQEAITAIKAKTNVPIVFITPIRRGTSLSSDPMLKLPVICGIIANVALANQCNVICGFDFPIPTYTTGYVDNMTRDGLHPIATGANVYARSVINALM